MANLRVDNLCGNGFVSANDGTVWSNYVTSTTGSTLTNYPATYGFDGNIANFVYADNNSTMTWTPPNGGIKAGLIEVYVYAGNTHPLVRVNGVSTGAVVGSATPNQLGNWVDVTSLVAVLVGYDNWSNECQQEYADMNEDGNYNVLDVVTLANCVLQGNCEN